MMIEPTRANATTPATSVSRSAPVERTQGTERSTRSADGVQLSEKLEELRRVRDMAAAQPDLRADRVAAIKTAIDNGTYQVDVNELAARMIDVI